MKQQNFLPTIGAALGGKLRHAKMLPTLRMQNSGREFLSLRLRGLLLSGFLGPEASVSKVLGCFFELQC